MADRAPEPAAELQRFLLHLTVERRLAARTVAMYPEALLRLQASAWAAGVAKAMKSTVLQAMISVRFMALR